MNRADYRVVISLREADTLSEKNAIDQDIVFYEKLLLQHYEEFYGKFDENMDFGKPLFSGFTEGQVLFYSLMTLFNDIDSGGLITYYYRRGIVLPYMIIRNFAIIDALDVEKALNRASDKMLEIFKKLIRENSVWGWREFTAIYPYEELNSINDFIDSRRSNISANMVNYIKSNMHEFCLFMELVK